MDVKPLLFLDRGDKWWSEPKFLNALSTAAHDLVKKFKGDHYVAVGNSGAWLLFCAELMGQDGVINLHKEQVTYAAFSGKFTQIIPRKKPMLGGWVMPRTFAYKSVYDATQSPSRDEVAAYRAYLCSLNLTPKKIVERARNGQQTVLVDVFASGEGVASFCKVMLDWANEEGIDNIVASNLKIANFLYRVDGKPEPGKIIIDNYPPIDVRNINPENYNLEFVSDTSNRGKTGTEINDEPSRERILPYFSFREWAKGLPTLKNVATLQTIIGSLKNHFCPNKQRPGHLPKDQATISPAAT